MRLSDHEHCFASGHGQGFDFTVAQAPAPATAVFVDSRRSEVEERTGASKVESMKCERMFSIALFFEQRRSTTLDFSDMVQ